MLEQRETEPAFSLVGGALCLDFTNTVGGRAGDPGKDEPSVARDSALREKLGSYHELLRWSEQAGALNRDDARRLEREAERNPAEAAAVLARAITLREALYALFSKRASGSTGGAEDLEELNVALGDALAHRRLARQEGRFAWQWIGGEQDLGRMLWPVALSAAELLLSGELDVVRECASDSCSWLFVDTSKNHSRRWCSMQDCGNRAKARRHYRRKRQIVL